MTSRSVLVSGAGIAGLTAATHLARSGLHVTVLEKHAEPGGRCARLVRDGHRFDIGPTLFVMPLLYEAEFRALGARLGEQLELRPVDPTYRLVFDDGGQLALTSDMASMRQQLEGMEHGSFDVFRRYVREGAGHYEVVVDGLVNHEFRRLTDLLSLRRVGLVRGLRSLANHYGHVAAQFKAPGLRCALTFQDLYVGLSPFEAPATLSFLPYTELTHGVWFPRGGMYSIIEALVALAGEAGVDLRLGSEVTRIETDRDRARGVRLADGSHLVGDAVLANADLPWVYQHLLPADGAADSLARRRFSSSTISFFWGLDRTYEELGPHTLFLPDDYRATFDAITRDLVMPANPAVYVHAPTRLEPAMAPPGADSLTAIVPVAHMRDEGGEDWDALRDVARHQVLRRLASLGIRDLADHIKFEEAYTPITWADRHNLVKGATHGLSHRLTQMALFRPPNRHRRYRNLYFAGASTHPGTGLPTAMVSGRYAARRLAAELL